MSSRANFAPRALHAPRTIVESVTEISPEFSWSVARTSSTNGDDTAAWGALHVQRPDGARAGVHNVDVMLVIDDGSGELKTILSVDHRPAPERFTYQYDPDVPRIAWERVASGDEEPETTDVGQFVVRFPGAVVARTEWSIFQTAERVIHTKLGYDKDTSHVTQPPSFLLSEGVGLPAPADMSMRRASLVYTMTLDTPLQITEPSEDVVAYEAASGLPELAYRPWYPTQRLVVPISKLSQVVTDCNSEGFGVDQNLLCRAYPWSMLGDSILQAYRSKAEGRADASSLPEPESGD